MKYLFISLTLLFFFSCSTTSSLQQESHSYHQYIPIAYLNKLDFQGEEVISTFMNKNFYYVRKDGKAIQTLTYEGKADPFSDGLARTKVNGKTGFFNTNLDVILKPIYDFAFPFYNGTAEICTGCQEKKIGTSNMLDGGKWQKIDRTGLVIE